MEKLERKIWCEKCSDRVYHATVKNADISCLKCHL